MLACGGYPRAEAPCLLLAYDKIERLLMDFCNYYLEVCGNFLHAENMPNKHAWPTGLGPLPDEKAGAAVHRIKRAGQLGGSPVSGGRFPFAAGNRGNELAGIIMPRIAEDLRRRTIFDNTALVHHRHLVADLAGHAQIVGNEDH